LKPEIFLDTKFEPQKCEESGVISITYGNGRTLFDDYFLAVLQGVSTAAAAPDPDGSIYDEIPEILVSFSFDVAKAAIKKREEYFTGEVSK
jgi:hypothetical protein